MPPFTSATGSAAAHKSHAPGAARRSADGLQQALELRDLSYKAAVSICVGFSAGTKISREDATALTGLVRAWESCDERIRIHRKLPLPGTRRPGPEPPKRAKQRVHKNLPPLPSGQLSVFKSAVAAG